jgi:hypothetical protein
MIPALFAFSDLHFIASILRYTATSTGRKCPDPRLVGLLVSYSVQYVAYRLTAGASGWLIMGCTLMKR